MRILQELRADGTRLVTYCPVDLTPLPPDMAPLVGADAIVAYTEYGRAALSTAFAATCSGGAKPPHIHVIPHGLDASVFFPVDRAHARLRLLGDGHQDDFIVLNANRNQPRKRIDTTVRGFALFSQGRPAGVRLHLHMGVRDRGWDIASLVRRYGLEQRTIFTTDDDSMPFVSSPLLNLVYNAADVGINTATAEGWGLVSFEHSATRAPQILPGHSVIEELWEDAATLLAPRVSLTTPDGLFDEHYVAADDVATALERLYVDHDYRRRMAAAALAHAQQPRYSWDHISTMWCKLLDSVLTSSPRTLASTAL